MMGKHDVMLWGVVMGLPTASFETRMGHASITKAKKQADDALLVSSINLVMSSGFEASVCVLNDV